MVKKAGKTRLDRIKEKLQKTNLGGGSDFWKPKQGANTIRILPGVGEMEDIFWSQVGTHYIGTGYGSSWKGKTFICPAFTVDEPCPICEFVNALYSTGNEDDRELAKQYKVSKTYAVNIIDRKEPDKGPQVWPAGVTVMRQFGSLLTDPEYGDLIIDVEDGLDLTVTRTGEARQTVYDVKAKRRQTPLSDDPDQADKWLESAIDLTPVELTDDPEEDALAYKDADGTQVAVFGIMPYDRIKQEFEGVEEEPEDEDAEEDDEEDAEEDDEEDEDEDEEEAPASPVRKAISARRSGHGDAPSTRSPRRRRG